MTRIAIVGGGRAATLHAEAARVASHVDLIGVGGRATGTATALAEAAGVPDLPLDRMIKRASGIVVAVPPSEVSDVLAAIPRDLPVLVENPSGPHVGERAGMTAANLLHAAETKRALNAIRELGAVHHLALRTRTTTPTWGAHADGRFGGGVLAYPGAGALAVLLAAAGVAVETVSATIQIDELGQDTVVNATLQLTDNRTAHLSLEWTPSPGANDGEIEAAGAAGVVHLRLWPQPELELDGRPIDPSEAPPLVALGFVEQIQRFALGCSGDRPFWPPLAVGAGVASIVLAARESANDGGRKIACN